MAYAIREAMHRRSCPLFLAFVASIFLLVETGWSALKTIQLHVRCQELLTGSNVNSIPLYGMINGGHPFRSIRVERHLDQLDSLIWTYSRKNGNAEVGSWELIDTSGATRAAVIVIGDVHRIDGGPLFEAHKALWKKHRIPADEFLMVRARHNHNLVIPTKQPVHRLMDANTSYPAHYRFSRQDRKFSEVWRKKIDQSKNSKHVFFEDQMTYVSGEMKKESYILAPEVMPVLQYSTSIKSYPEETQLYLYVSPGQLEKIYFSP